MNFNYKDLKSINNFDDASSTYLYQINESKPNEDFSESVFNTSFLDLNELKEDEYVPLPKPKIPKTSTPSSKLSYSKPFAVLDVLEHYAISDRPQNNKFKMEKLADCSNFSGYSQENASKFLSEFESYALLHDLRDMDRRKIAAFHLHLKGPALTWFNSLSQTARNSWATISILFREKYINCNHNSSIAMMEGQIFNAMRLMPGDKLEDFHSKLVEKGLLLNKPEHEILSKFIDGLPEKMAFFVRAGQPTDLAHALTAAKMAETCNYRSDTQDITKLSPASTTTATISTPAPTLTSAPPCDVDPKIDRVDQLAEQVSKLTSLMSQMQTRQNYQNLNRNRPNDQRNSSSFARSNNSNTSSASARTCYNCNAPGHLQAECNWNGTGQPNNAKCQLCHQMGHAAFRCKSVQRANSGNQTPPLDSRPNRSGH